MAHETDFNIGYLRRLSFPRRLREIDVCPLAGGEPQQAQSMRGLRSPGY